jgi:hypothetical protein
MTQAMEDDADNRWLTIMWTMDNNYVTQTMTQMTDGNADDGKQCTRRMTTHMMDADAHNR